MKRPLALTLTVLLICSAGAGAQVLFEDDFEGTPGTAINDKAWETGGWASPLFAVRDGSLRMVVEGVQHHAKATTRKADFDFFAQPLTVTWDLDAERTLAGPYPAKDWGRAYAGLSIGPDEKGAKTATLGLSAFANGYPKDVKEGWFYTLNLGQLAPQYPKDEWRITGVPSRIIWTLDATTSTVTLEGATFVDGSRQRSAEHGLARGDFADDGMRLQLYVRPQWEPMRAADKCVPPGVLYTQAIKVSAGNLQSQDVAKGEPVDLDATIHHYKLPDLGGKNTGPAQYTFGINYAGGNFHGGFTPAKPESLDYWKSKGILLMRLPIKWHVLQPELNGPFDEEYIKNVKLTVDRMAERDMKVILDLHNYMRYNKELIGSDAVPVEAFTDVWRRLAEAFKDQPAVWGYGLMNEPFDSEGKWPAACQAGIDGVRAADMKKPILVAGDGYSSARRWPELSGDLHKQINDPANNLIYEAHCYFDFDGSGLYKHSYEYEINRPGSTVGPDVAVERIKPFVDWLKANNLRGIIGEFSVPANPDRDPRWLVILDNAYKYMAEENLPSTYWAGGTLWTRGLAYVIEPWGGPDRAQTEILLKHANQAQR